MMTARWVCAALALVAAGCASSGRGPTPIDPPPAPVVTFAVSVTDATTGAAVGEARVDVQYTPTEDDGRTNADGYWSALAPAYAGFVVEIHADGYQTASLEIPALGDNLQRDVALDPAVTTPWPGRLAVGAGARCFVNGNGDCELPLILHFGEAFSLETRDPSTVEAELVEAKRAGYDGIRTWDTLGYWDSAWAGKEVMPWRFFNHSGRWIDATPDYYGQLERFVGKVKAAGLTTQLSRGDLNSASLSQVLEHTERVAQTYDRVGWDTMTLAEALNEQWQNGGWGPSDLRRIVEPFKRRGAITALSAGFDGEEPDVVRAFAADVFYIHGARGPGYQLILRHIFSLAREQLSGVPRLGWQGEPAGPGNGVTGGQVNDREMLALMAAQAFISRQAWTYMSSHGVFHNGRISSQPGYWAVPRIRDAMEAFGRDLMAWHLTHRSAGDAALRSDCPTSDGDCRIDQTIAPDGRIAATVYSPTGRQSVQNATVHSLSCDVIGVADDEQLTRTTVTLSPGDWFPLTYRVGRLLLCRPLASGDVFPGASLNNGGDVAPGDPESPTQPGFVGDDASGVERPDLPHGIGRQLAAANALTLDVSPLAHRVSDVISRSSDEQVFGVHARRDITRVANESPLTADVAIPDRFIGSHVTSSGSVVRSAAVFTHRSRSAYFTTPFAASGETPPFCSPVQ